MSATQASGDIGRWHKLQNFLRNHGFAQCELPVSRVPTGGLLVN